MQTVSKEGGKGNEDNYGLYLVLESEAGKNGSFDKGTNGQERQLKNNQKASTKEWFCETKIPFEP